MAVHCGTCGTRLHDATENYGGFQTTPDFRGWNREPGAPRAVISETCERCHARLAAAVVTAANEIVAENQKAVDALRDWLLLHRQRESEYDKAKSAAMDAFQREWTARRGG